MRVSRIGDGGGRVGSRAVLGAVLAALLVLSSTAGATAATTGDARPAVPPTLTGLIDGLSARSSGPGPAVSVTVRLRTPASAIALELPEGTDRAWLRGDGPGGPSGWLQLDVLDEDDGPDDAPTAAGVTDLVWVRANDAFEVVAPPGTPLDEVKVHLYDTLGLRDAAADGPAAVDALLARLAEPTALVEDVLAVDPADGDPLAGLAEALALDGLLPGLGGSADLEDLVADDAPALPDGLEGALEVPGGLLGSLLGLLGSEDGAQPPTPARGARPPVVRRAEWGAAAPRSSHATARPRSVVLHHTATRNDHSRAESPAIVRAIQRHHQQTLGWSDVGYNLLVDRFGQVFEGRAGGLEAGVVGAHARGYNTGTVGVAVIGNLDQVQPTRATLDRLADVLAWQARVHGISLRDDARATVGGRSIATFLGHRDLAATACPGRHLHARIPEIRRAAR